MPVFCIISKLAKDKVSSEGKGLTENRHYAPLAILKHTNVCCRLRCRPLTEKDKKNFRWNHLDKYTMIFIQLYMQQTKSFYGKIRVFDWKHKKHIKYWLQIRRIVHVLFKKRAGPRLRIVLSGLKDVSPLEVFKPDNTRLPFFFRYRSTHSCTTI